MRVKRPAWPAQDITINGINIVKKSQLWYDIQGTDCYSLKKQRTDHFVSEGGMPWIMIQGARDLLKSRINRRVKSNSKLEPLITDQQVF